ncbi:HNH endonuclease [Terrisporobacter glycolicus]|uniref:HNH endonuclease n=1 Tax=Terrisporobacter glycolicus TaxID=36841 RepID=UPI003464961C
MEKKSAENLYKMIIKYSENSSYIVKELDKSEYDKRFTSFDRKEEKEKNNDLLGLISVSKDNELYYFVFINWRYNENYYIVLYSSDKFIPLVELHKIEYKFNSLDIKWRYIPRKQDGLNESRKDCFRKYYGDIFKYIEVTNNPYDIELFLDDIFDLLDKKIKSDNIDFKESRKTSFPEGRKYEKVHKSRERNSALINIVKNERLKQNKNLICEICGFNFKDVYGELGEGFIEAHHIIPVSELDENSETKKEDIALVCSNCHSMLHKKRPWLNVEELKSILLK